MERSGSSSTGSPIVLDSSFRRKSSVTNSPATNGISKSRRRKGPLPAISVDPSDKIALKRARNTLAARESRQRKFDHVSELEKINSDLQAELDKWKSIAIAHGYNGA
jgi:general control protein GCN4